MERIRVWLYRPSDRSAIQLQYLDPVTRKKRTRSARTTNEAEAEAKRVDLEADLNAGRHHDVPRLIWQAFRERFEAEYVAPLRANTRKIYRRTLDLFGELAGQTAVAAIGAPLVSRFAATLRGRGFLPGTVALRLQQLKTALAWAVDQGALVKVPVFPMVKVPRKNPQPVPKELLERLLARAPDQQMRTFLLAGWFAALRLDEAFVLSREESTEAPWVDFTRRRIWFPAEASKGCADAWIPLPAELQAALEALPDQGPRFFRFTTKRGRPISVSGVGWRIVRLAKKAGVRLSMRALRRGRISELAGQLLPQLLMRFARHQKIETTLRYYCNVDDALEAAILGNTADNSPAETVKSPGN